MLWAVRHFCGYVQKPTWEDREQLLQELRIDESFGLVGEEFTLADAPEGLIQALQEHDNWEVHDGQFRRR